MTSPSETRIEIVPHGPYRVYGDVQLLDVAPVVTFNGEPIEWHTFGRIEPPGRPFDLCRCARSAAMPYCDRACETSRWDSDDRASRASYRESATYQVHGDETLADSLPLCINAGFCGTRTRKVWDMFERDDPDERRLMHEMVWRCPSGRLTLLAPNGLPDEPPLAPSIAILPGGPVWVRGGVVVIGEAGVWEPRNRVTLCRCGQSKNTPFCDGTHEDIHFDER